MLCGFLFFCVNFYCVIFFVVASSTPSWDLCSYSGMYCSIHACTSDRKATHSPKISFSSLTACSSPSMSTDSIVQKNCTLSSRDIIVVYTWAPFKCYEHMFTNYQLDLLTTINLQTISLIDFKLTIESLALSILWYTPVNYSCHPEKTGIQWNKLHLQISYHFSNLKRIYPAA